MSEPKSIIVLYSKYSDECTDVITYKQQNPVNRVFKFVCIDNADVREYVEKLNISCVPAVLVMYSDEDYEIFEGQGIREWINNQLGIGQEVQTIQEFTQQQSIIPQQVPMNTMAMNPQQSPPDVNTRVDLGGSSRAIKKAVSITDIAQQMEQARKEKDPTLSRNPTGTAMSVNPMNIQQQQMTTTPLAIPQQTTPLMPMGLQGQQTTPLALAPLGMSNTQPKEPALPGIPGGIGPRA